MKDRRAPEPGAVAHDPSTQAYRAYQHGWRYGVWRPATRDWLRDAAGRVLRCDTPEMAHAWVMPGGHVGHVPPEAR